MTQNGGAVTRPKYEYRYDGRGNLIGIRDPLFGQNATRQTTMTFDERGNPLTRTLPDGLSESSVYDDFGRMTRMTSFEGVVAQYVYDDGPIGGGRLLQKKFYATVAAFNAGTIKETQSMTYDALGREVSIVWDRNMASPGTTVDTWTNQYDDQSRLVRVTSPTGSVFYEYDVFGRQTRVSSRGTGFQPVNASDFENDIRHTYDVFGRLATVQAFERNNVAVDVDAVAAGNQPQTAAYAYSLNGSLDYQTNPDGSVTDFTYDDLNRLTDIDEYKKDPNESTPAVFTDNPKLSEYSYTLRPDGKRDFADEIIRKDDGTVFSHTTFDWNYDAAGRLIDEVFTDVGNLMAGTDDYRATYTHDLTGNRLKKTVTSFNAEPQATAYTFDANDRMLTESLDTANNATIDQTTTYGYTGTQQSSKSVVSQISNIQISNQTFAYDLQGRMNTVTIAARNPSTGVITRTDTIGYRYGTDGIRISARQDVTENSVTTTEITNYLIDAANHTGYQQVLEETVTDGNGNLLKKIVYTIGLDHISQTTFTTSGPAAGVTAVFHLDGHGSTRVLTDLAGVLFTVAALAQVFHFDAYGNALNFQMSQAATQYLYSGEQFDARIQQQYLRARYYNQATGTFNRLDPFFGNLSDPQSLHKYLYTHADPISGIDPSGNWTVSISIGTISISINVGNFLIASAASYAIGKTVEAAFLLAVDGDLDNFRWFTAWDLLAFIPGDVIAGAFAKIIRYPTALLTRHGGAVVGKLFTNGTTAKLSTYFASKFPKNRSLWRPGINGGTTFTLSPTGFQHIIGRHLPQCYDGTRQLAHQVTGFWPVGTSADDVLLMLKDAMFRCTRVAGTNAIQEDVKLANGIIARLATNAAGEVITFFPKSGPGITTVQESIQKGLL